MRNIHGGTVVNDWIPWVDRTHAQKKLSHAYNERIGSFGSMGGEVGNLPERVIYAEKEVETIGKPLMRIWQVTGSCVGAAAATAYLKTQLCDVVYREDDETIKMVFPFATYGKGRAVGGMRRPGEGSFGAAQAEAVDPEVFGYLAWDDPRVPKPQINNGWAKWKKSDELKWSHPSSWPIPERELYETAGKYGITTTTRIRNAGDWKQAIGQGRPVTLAGMFGTRPRVEGDVLLGRWNTQWAHQQSCSGYWEHPTHGLIFLIDNQWGPQVHGECPTLAPLGVFGSYWMLERDANKMCKTGEVIAHSGTGDFEPREIQWKWGSLGTFED